MSVHVGIRWKGAVAGKTGLPEEDQALCNRPPVLRRPLQPPWCNTKQQLRLYLVHALCCREQYSCMALVLCLTRGGTSCPHLHSGWPLPSWPRRHWLHLHCLAPRIKVASSAIDGDHLHSWADSAPWNCWDGPAWRHRSLTLSTSTPALHTGHARGQPLTWIHLRCIAQPEVRCARGWKERG
jgi:hypothetical protein